MEDAVGGNIMKQKKGKDIKRKWETWEIWGERGKCSFPANIFATTHTHTHTCTHNTKTQKYQQHSLFLPHSSLLEI